MLFLFRFLQLEYTPQYIADTSHILPIRIPLDLGIPPPASNTHGLPEYMSRYTKNISNNFFINFWN